MPSSKDPAATQEFKISALPPEAAEDSDLIPALTLNLGLARVPGRDDAGTARFHRNAVLSLPVIASRDHLHDPAKRKEMKW